MKQLFTRWLLMITLMIMGVTTVMAQKSVLDESFTSGSRPDGWTQARSFWRFQEGNAQFYAPVENNAYDTLFSSLLDLSELDNQPSVAITYSNTASGDKVNELKVLYRASEDDDWSVWQTFDAATDGQVYIKDVLPDGLSEVQIAIAGSYLLGADTRVYRLAVENKTEASAAPTGLRYEDLTTTNVTLWWEPCSSVKFEQYNVKISTTQLTNPSAEPGDISDMVGWGITDEFYELEDLTPNTEYWLYVQYDCGDGDVSPWAEMSFRTLCLSVNAPFTENFEGELSSCFTIIKGGSVAAVSGEFACNSTKSFKSNSAATKYNYLILPEINGVIKDYQVSFNAAALEAGNAYTRSITIGVCTDATEESFTQVKQLDLPKGRVWESVVVSLAGYAGTGKYIAFKLGNEDHENRIFIDDIRVETASSCPKPMFVEVFDITSESAKLKWVETGNASGWNLVLATKPISAQELADGTNPDSSKGEYDGEITVNPYTATDLIPNTTYYAYLQAGCGSSEWTNAVSFTTSREVGYPYIEAFDKLNPDVYTNDANAVPEGWLTDARCVNNLSGYYDYQPSGTDYHPYVSSAKDHSGSAYVPAALLLKGEKWGDTWATNAQSSIAILPAMPKAVNLMQVTFYAYAEASNTRIVVGVANTQANDMGQGGQMGVNIIAVDTIAIASLETWNKYIVTLEKYQGTGRYIVFYQLPPEALPTGKLTSNVYIDDITVEDIQYCNAVLSLAAVPSSVSSANITWVDNSTTTTSWRVKVSSGEIDPTAVDGDVVADATVSEKQFNATGLIMGTTYHVYVSPTCGNIWEHTAITIPTGITLPYFNDFTNESTGNNAGRGPKDWTLGNTSLDAWTTQAYVPYVYASAWTNPPVDVTKNSLYIYAPTTTSQQFPYAIMPELLEANIKDVRLSFYAYTDGTNNFASSGDAYYSEMKVGVVNSPTYINTTDIFNNVTNIATIRCKASKVAEFKVVDFSGYAGDGKYIVFYAEDGSKTNKTYIDNISITLATEPQPVSEITTTEINETSVKLTWLENGNATKWNIKLFTSQPSDPDTDEAVKSLTVTSKPAEITGLKHSTQYFAYIQSDQANGKSNWNKIPFVFWTECGKVKLPYLEDFNRFETGSSSLNTLTPCFLVGDKNGGQLNSTYTGTSYYSCNYVKSGYTSSTPNGTGTSYYYVDHTYGSDPSTHTFYMTAGNNKLALLVLPEVDGDLANCKMTFYGSYSSAFALTGAFSAVEVCVLNANGTYTTIENCKLTKAKEWEEFTVTFPSDIHSGRVAFRMNNDATWRTALGRTSPATSATCYMYLDDIKISVISECKQVKDVAVSSIDSVSATISWNATEASAWNLKVSSTLLDDVDAETADIFDGSVSTTPSKTITGLTPDTKYYVYAQAVRPDQSCVGDWSQWITFRTLCLAQQASSYSEDFETMASGDVPECAYLSGQDEKHSNVETKFSKKMLKVYEFAKGHANYFAFPAISEDVRNLQVNMHMYSGGTDANTMYRYQIGIMTNPYEPSTFVALYTDSILGSSETRDRRYVLSNYNGDDQSRIGKYVAIRALSSRKISDNSTSTGVIYIDDISIDAIQSCLLPYDLDADSIGIYGAKLIWKTDNKTAAHRVRVYTSADANPNSIEFAAEVVVNDSVAIIEGLQGNTTYYAFARKECSASDVSSWCSVHSFTTDCPDAQALPYVEDFEAYAKDAIPGCWTAIDNASSPSQSRVSTTYASAGSNSLCVTYGQKGGSGGTSYYQTSIILPALDITSLKDVIMYFDVRSSANTGGLKIEALETNTSTSAAVEITTISGLTTAWETKSLNFGELYEGAYTYYKYIKLTPTVNGKSIYIDNLFITTDPNATPPVQKLKTLAVTDTTIQISFVEPTPSVVAWEVAYGLEGVNVDVATKLDVTETNPIISDLEASTAYDFYVRATGTRDWVGPLTASTVAPAATLPYATGFEDATENAKWNLVSMAEGLPQVNYFIIGDAAKCAATGDKALFVTNNGSDWQYEVSKNATVWATRDVEIPNPGTYYFSAKLKVPANEQMDMDNASVYLVPAGSKYSTNITFPSGETMPHNWPYILLSEVRRIDDWVWMGKSIDVTESGFYILAIKWKNIAWPTPINPIAVDSVMLDEYLCTLPQTIVVEDKSSTSISLSWFAGRCEKFEYVVSRFANLANPALIEASDKAAAGIISNGPSVTINGLLPLTNYSFYVRTICPEGETNWVEYRFSTPCEGETLPYTESFAETPECWILSNASAITVQYRSEEMKTAGIDPDIWSCLRIGGNGYAILPELNVPLNKVAVEIGVFNQAQYSSVALGTVERFWDFAGSWEHIQSCTPTHKTESASDPLPYEVDTFTYFFNAYSGNGKQLALRNTTGDNIYVRYVKLTELPDCVAPRQVEITNIEETEATINWLAGTESKWEIKVNDDEPFEVNTNPYVLTSLTQGTEYTIAVRAVCDATHTSEWSVPVSFLSACGVHALPMNEDFNSLRKYRLAELPCWENRTCDKTIEEVVAGIASTSLVDAHAPASQYWTANANLSLGDENQLSSMNMNYSGAKYNWFISPQYAIEGSASLSFEARMCNPAGRKADTNVEGRFFVAISTDNGVTWARTINLTSQLDTVYQTLSISLNDYSGQAIRVAFYHESVNSKNQEYLLIDNVRMNCTDTYLISDGACSGYDYKDYGFDVKEDELAIVGQSKQFTRFATNVGNGCDSTVVLTLTTYASKVAEVHESICRGEAYEFGGQQYTKPAQEELGEDYYYIRGETVFGCDSIIRLYLTVNESDTTDMLPVEVKANQLPYEIDEYYTIPMDAAVGSFTAIAKRDGCSFNRYFITVSDIPSSLIEVTDDIESIEIYDALGRRVQTLRQGEIQKAMPTGVYMLRTIMKSGAVVNRKVTLK